VKNKSRMITPLLALTLAAQVAPHLYAQADDEHAVFAMTNSVEGNQIIAYSRAADGSLVELNQYPTGGRGSGGTTDPPGCTAHPGILPTQTKKYRMPSGPRDFSAPNANCVVVGGRSLGTSRR
jgi:hypothetical protein